MATITTHTHTKLWTDQGSLWLGQLVRCMYVVVLETTRPLDSNPTYDVTVGGLCVCMRAPPEGGSAAFRPSHVLGRAYRLAIQAAFSKSVD